MTRGGPRGKAEIELLIATLEEILQATAADGTTETRLQEIAARHRFALGGVNRLFEEGLDEREFEALHPLLADVDRLNALATASTRREVEHVGGELAKVRQAAGLRRMRATSGVGRSCDVAG